MKRISAFLLAAVVMFTLAGCGGASSQAGTGQPQSAADSAAESSGEVQAESRETDEQVPETESQETGAAESEKEASSGSDMLVVYFSRTGEQYNVGVIDKGNTAIVAEMIGEKTGADLWEVLPEEDNYPMTYNELTEVAKKEQSENARPAYKGEVPDLSQYSTIFIGAPVWWGDWPMIMYTFFENNQEALAGKTLIPFSTHEGSGLSGFDKKLSSACPDSTVGQGLAIQGNDCQNEQESVSDSVDQWLYGLGR